MVIVVTLKKRFGDLKTKDGYPLSCKGEYNPNKRCRTKYKNSAIPKCLQENNLQCTQGQTEFNAFGVTDGNFNQVSYKKNSLLMVKEPKINHIMKKILNVVVFANRNWSGDKCDIPVSWENR